MKALPDDRYHTYIKKILLLFTLLLLLPAVTVSAKETMDSVQKLYDGYRQRFYSITREDDIEQNGFKIIKKQVFPVELETFGEVTFIPALDAEYSRMALFLSDTEGNIVFQTDQLETNSWNKGALEQPNKGIAAVSFQDLNEDGLWDIVLITTCMNESGDYAGKPYKVGDVLFQGEKSFYRDWRLSDKINRFSMNKGIDSITAFVTGGYSTEFLYTATTMDELLDNGFEVAMDQYYWRRFEKLGKLLVVPGVYQMSNYSVFMIYLVNEQGYIVWSLQPMGDYDNLYALKGIHCRDIDGDGLKDIVVLARYSYEDDAGQSVVENDYAVYYQRTGGFMVDKDIKKHYRCSEDDTVEKVVEKAREYWGWESEK